jgi:hypothetical protein
LKAALTDWIKDKNEKDIEKEKKTELKKMPTLIDAAPARIIPLEIKVDDMDMWSEANKLTYKFSKTSLGTNLQNAIEVELFKKAKALHPSFIRNRLRDSKIPTLKMLGFRMDDNKVYDEHE